jgi:hypothetical protein
VDRILVNFLALQVFDMYCHFLTPVQPYVADVALDCFDWSGRWPLQWLSVLVSHFLTNLFRFLGKIYVALCTRTPGVHLELRTLRVCQNRFDIKSRSARTVLTEGNFCQKVPTISFGLDPVTCNL